MSDVVSEKIRLTQGNKQKLVVNGTAGAIKVVLNAATQLKAKILVCNVGTLFVDISLNF